MTFTLTDNVTGKASVVTVDDSLSPVNAAYVLDEQNGIMNTRYSWWSDVQFGKDEGWITDETTGYRVTDEAGKDLGLLERTVV